VLFSVDIVATTTNGAMSSGSLVGFEPSTLLTSRARIEHLLIIGPRRSACLICFPQTADPTRIVPCKQCGNSLNFCRVKIVAIRKTAFNLMKYREKRPIRGAVSRQRAMIISLFKEKCPAAATMRGILPALIEGSALSRA
jgi:hypothetical protein